MKMTDFSITSFARRCRKPAPGPEFFEHRLAGHLETGHDSMSDPAIGTVQPLAQARHNQTVTS